MHKRLIVLVALLVVGLVSTTFTQAPPQTPPRVMPWNNSGLAQMPTPGESGPAPRRDLTGLWNAGGAGIAPRGAQTSPLTPWGEKLGNTHKSGDGIRMVEVADNNDPLSTKGDPAGFPRLLLFELRPVQIVQTPNQVLMLYMFEKRWRTIWTDGRALPTDPDPRWYGYSVGRWEDDTTFVVDTVGMDERTWLDNAGNPHSDQMKVEERYHRVNQGTLELTVTIDDAKAYTKPWVARNKLPLKMLPPGLDLIEMIPSATEAAAYREIIGLPSKK